MCRGWRGGGVWRRSESGGGGGEGVRRGGGGGSKPGRVPLVTATPAAYVLWGAHVGGSGCPACWWRGAVYEGDAFLGVWTMDVRLADLHADLALETLGRIGERQTNFLVDYDGRLLAHPALDPEAQGEKGAVYNVRLASRLTGWAVDLVTGTPDAYEERFQVAHDAPAAQPMSAAAAAAAGNRLSASAARSRMRTSETDSTRPPCPRAATTVPRVSENFSARAALWKTGAPAVCLWTSHTANPLEWDPGKRSSPPMLLPFTVARSRSGWAPGAGRRPRDRPGSVALCGRPPADRTRCAVAACGC